MRDSRPQGAITVSLSDSVYELFVSLSKSLAPEYYTLIRRPEERGITVHLAPKTQEYARIAAHVDDDEVVLTCGRGTVLEIPERGHRYVNLPLLEELRLIATAVIDGHLEETAWFRGDKLIKCRGYVRIPGRILRTYWSGMFTAFWGRTEKRRFSYQPYPKGSPSNDEGVRRL